MIRVVATKKVFYDNKRIREGATFFVPEDEIPDFAVPYDDYMKSEEEKAAEASKGPVNIAGMVYNPPKRKRKARATNKSGDEQAKVKPKPKTKAKAKPKPKPKVVPEAGSPEII